MRTGTEQVMPEAHDHIALVEPVVRRNRAAEGQRQCRLLDCRSDRVGTGAAHPWILLRQLCHLPEQGGRSRRTGENAEALALPVAPVVAERKKLGAERVPGRRGAAAKRRLRAL